MNLVEYQDTNSSVYKIFKILKEYALHWGYLVDSFPSIIYKKNLYEIKYITSI